ncbi:hypothetical protein ACIBIZ_09865 [Nonomuraea spiralis]|uniref:hypothetical protein n=1 Tax=Nonomuraea TaxID=83681 RepID=UPI000F79CDC0|nr:hypothetical protein [Nonomuraea sp. WAC 01424]RSN09386.1 hypothetical protein DMB42_18980 [Nonomuraea sp. WAC 01424]
MSNERELPGVNSMPPPPRRGDAADYSVATGEDKAASAFRRALSSPRSREAVRALVDADGQLPIADLQSRAGMPFLQFTAMLAELAEDGLVTVTGPPGDEIVHLYREA